MTPNPRRRWPVVIAAGLVGSGSTWAYNAIRLLLEDVPEAAPLHCGFADRLGDLPEPREPPGAMLIKTHQPDRAMRILAGAAAAPVVLTVRDPRDACVSMMQRFGTGFDEMRPIVAMSADGVLRLAMARPALVLRYEDGFTRAAGTVARIAAFLGLRVAQERIETITESLLPDRVAAGIAGMVAAGRFGPAPAPHMADPVTQWHPGHVGDGRTGKWPEVLSDAQARMVMTDTRGFALRFGYVGNAAAAG